MEPKTDEKITNDAPTSQSGIIRELYYGTTLTEADGENDLPKIKAKVQEAGTVNRNGRIYPKNLMEREVGKMKSVLAERPGTVDHPEAFSASIDRLGILWTDIWLDGNDVWAEGKIIPTSAGKNLEAAIRAGVKVGISSRGYGTAKLEKIGGEDILIIQDDYELITFDAVTDPSVYTARVSTIESIEQVSQTAFNDEVVLEKLAEKIAVAIQEKRMEKEEKTEEVNKEEEKASEEKASAETDPKEESTNSKEEEVDNKDEEHEQALKAAHDKASELETKLAETEAELKKVKEAAGDAAAAIAAIIGLIGDELGQQDFYDVAELAYMAAALKRNYAGSDTGTGDMELDNKGAPDLTKLVDVVKIIVRKASTLDVNEYIDAVTKSEKHSATLAEFLQENCKTKEEVDAQLGVAKKLAAKFATEEKVPGGRGITTDTAVSVELSPIEELAIAGRVGLKKIK